MTKLSRDSVTGKLIACSNLGGKLLRGGCCPACEANVSSPCPAVYQWNLPESIHVNLSGISLAQQQVSGTCQRVWSPIGGWSACVYDCVYYCKTIGSGSLDGSFTIPLSPYWNYDGDYICGGSVIVQDAVNVLVHSYSGSECSGIYSEGLADMTVSLGIRPFQDASDEWVYEINSTISIEGCGIVFFAVSDPYPMVPEETRHGYDVTLQNSIEDTYDPTPVGECNVITAVPGWGGSADISASGLHTFYVWIEEFGGTDGKMVQIGDTVGAYLQLNDDELPHSTNLVVEYKVTYGGGLEETFRKCISSGGYVFLSKKKELGQQLGYTTIEIITIYSPDIPNLSWDTSHGLAGFAWGNFDIPDDILFVNSITPLPEDDTCTPCSNDKCYTTMCEVQLGSDPDGTSAENAVVHFDWRKDDSSWVSGGQAITDAGGRATLVTTECIGIDLVNPSVPFVVEFKVTDIVKDEYLYKPELNQTSTCVCGPVVPPPDCSTISPPTPNPAQHADNAPRKVFSGGAWYVLVEAAQPTSEPPTEDGYEYLFECIEDSAFNSGWRSADSVAGLTTPGGSQQVPYHYWAACDTAYTFRLKVRYVECQKETSWSDIRGIVNP